MDEHYVFTPPDTIERVDRNGNRTPVLAAPESTWSGQLAWGYAGSGPNSTAEAVLLDATGNDVPAEVAISFTDDILDFHELSEAPWKLTVAEVRAWRAEREAEILERYAKGLRVTSWASGATDRVEEAIRGGPRSTWVETYRTVHGTPDVE